MRWEVKPLGEVLDVIRNGLSKKQNKKQIGRRVSRIETIATGQINEEKVGWVDCDEVDAQKFSLFKGDILFSHINSKLHVGKTALVEEETDLIHGMNLLVFRQSMLKSKLLNWYLVKLRSDGFWIKTSKQSVNQASVNQKDICAVEIPIPPLDEQERIVEILDEAFVAIDKAKANIERNLTNARELFQSRLNDIFSNPSKDWEVKPLGEVVSILNGFAFKSFHAVQDSDVQLLRMGNIYRNKLDLSRKPVYYPDSFKVDYSNYVLHDGDLIMSLTGTVGKEDYGYVVEMTNVKVALLLNQRLMKIEVDEGEVLKSLIMHQMRSQNFLKRLFSIAHGTRQANLSSSKILRLIVAYPKVKSSQADLVMHIDRLHESTLSITATYEAELDNLEELRQSILEQAFEGKLTEPVAA